VNKPMKVADAPLRDWRGRFGVVTCTNGHDRCFYGPSLECPYCEVRSGTTDTTGDHR
jgi:hypothetical protein